MMDQNQLQRCHEFGCQRAGPLPVSRLCVPGSLPRFEAVIAILQPRQANRRRQGIGLDFTAVAQRVPFALHDQCRCADVAQVVDPLPFRSAGGVERITQAQQAIARRLGLYDQETAPLLDWFADHDLLVTVDGLGEEDDVFARLEEAIDARLA